MVRAEDENKIARITERFNLVQVDVATLRAEIIKEQEEKKANDQEAQNPPETEHPEKDECEKLADEILAKPIQREEPTVENPTAARTDADEKTKNANQSEQQSNNTKTDGSPNMQKNNSVSLKISYLTKTLRQSFRKRLPKLRQI